MLEAEPSLVTAGSADPPPFRTEPAPDPTRSEPGGDDQPAYVDLYWLPLGAHRHSVQLNGRIYEALVALIEQREPLDLYHAGLEIRTSEGRFVIEMTPVAFGAGAGQGVVAEGPVGMRALDSVEIFRYEVRCWRGGEITDRDAAVDSPRRLTEDPGLARRVIDTVPGVPTPVWGRDEMGTGDMWNSNSVIAWTLCKAGFDLEDLSPPERGRAPGWKAGIALADFDP